MNFPFIGIFRDLDDYWDVYFFDLPSFRNVHVKLRNIPFGDDYDLHVYDRDKVWLGSGTNVGSNNEDVYLTLDKGRYYIMVERVFPAPGAPPSLEPYIVRVTT